MGFLGDLLGEIFIGDGTVSSDNQRTTFAGQRMRRDSHALRDLYKHTYFDFGLKPLRGLKENELVPMKVSAWGANLLSFEIHGNILTPARFLGRGWGSPFHTIEREVAIHKGRVWAFDITRLHEGILTGDAIYQGDEAHVRSEEYLKILQAVGAAGIVHQTVPAIELGFGEIWSKYKVPDRIFVGLRAPYPLDDHHLQHLIKLILHAYNVPGAPPVTADYTKNISEGTVTLVMRETNVQPEPQTYREPQVFTQPQSSAQQAPESEPKPSKVDPSDGFPYDFYRGLGLINDDNTVTVPSILGPVKVDMTNEKVKLWLLSYQP